MSLSDVRSPVDLLLRFVRSPGNLLLKSSVGSKGSEAEICQESSRNLLLTFCQESRGFAAEILSGVEGICC
jgi:hypothetical protein